MAEPPVAEWLFVASASPQNGQISLPPERLSILNETLQ